VHELTLAEAILGVVLDVAEGQHVREVRVRAGALQRVIPVTLQDCFAQVAAGTPAADAVLTVDEAPARIGCHLCLAQVELTIPPFVCARCGASDVEFLSGDELLVDGVELDSGWLYRPGAYRSEGVAASAVSSRLAGYARDEPSRFS
jgi:hydrogenase nickel incorporation protein HypA/HybF